MNLDDLSTRVASLADAKAIFNTLNPAFNMVRGKSSEKLVTFIKATA